MGSSAITPVPANVLRLGADAIFLNSEYVSLSDPVPANVLRLGADAIFLNTEYVSLP